MNDESKPTPAPESGNNKLIAALIEVQRTMKPAVKDCENPHFKSKYASLESCWEAAREPLAHNGFAVTNQTVIEGESIVLETALRHISGAVLATTLPLVLVQKNMQQLGSALSYARRYNLKTLLGINDEDDDGNVASRDAKGKAQKPHQDEPPKKSTESKPLPPTSGKMDWQEKAASEKQVQAVWTLWKKCGYSEDDYRKMLKGAGLESSKHMTGGFASKLINDLKQALGEKASA